MPYLYVRNYQLTLYLRLEALTRLDAIVRSGKCQDKELRSLSQQVTTLKGTIDHMDSGSTATLLDDIRLLLNLSDHAIGKVLQNKILQALRFENMENRLENIEEARMSTFEWLLDHAPQEKGDLIVTDHQLSESIKIEETVRLEVQKDFINWLCYRKGIFHISGKPGAGKSTLMKYLSESPTATEYLKAWSGNKQLVVASFFFWKRGTEVQRSFQGLLRSLLHSVLSQCPELIQSIVPTKWEAARDGLTINFSKSEVEEAFAALMNKPDVYGKHKFAFFIDGLDEFEGREESLIRLLLSWVRSGGDNLKICVSSRELPVFEERFTDCPKFSLHQVTRRDLFVFVHDTLRSNDDVTKLSESQKVMVMDLGQQLVQKADGVFLWVSLALKTLEQGLVQEDNIPKLKTKIDLLPAELEELFRVIFVLVEQSNAVDRRQAMCVLSLVVHLTKISPARGISLLPLSFLEEYENDNSFTDHLLMGSLTETEIENRLRRCRKQTNGVCKGLVTVISHPRGSSGDQFRRDEVLLTHRSLIEFFDKPDTQARIEQFSKPFNRVQFYGQALIAELTVSAATHFEEFQTSVTAEISRSFVKRAMPRSQEGDEEMFPPPQYI